ncbi:MAG: hypothetical protein UX89_C0001G0083 [Parcubacteria group bacterium GW2011_GWA2_47_16]|nr:MAG: hypothetical protein UX89_C0001G0083 [Parcubacteria group bacterium GW2011_GWA2_47_16]
MKKTNTCGNQVGSLSDRKTEYPSLFFGLFKPWEVVVFVLSVGVVIWCWFHFYVHPRDAREQKEFGGTNQIQKMP